MINDEELIHSGFVTIVGRPNVGKSTLVNRILGTKVSIVSDKPQTTRMQVRGVLNRPDAQIVFVDTPGLHKPRTALGERTNASAVESIGGVDVVVFVLDATGPIARGDNFVSEMLPRSTLCVLNKIDGLSKTSVDHNRRAGIRVRFVIPISARTGLGVEEGSTTCSRDAPRGTALSDRFAADRTRKCGSRVVREQLLRLTHDELTHSITTRVTEGMPRIRVEILVGAITKGIAIGKNGACSKRSVGSTPERPPVAFLSSTSARKKGWQRAATPHRLGF